MTQWVTNEEWKLAVHSNILREITSQLQSHCSNHHTLRVATCSEPSSLFNWLNGQQSGMFSQMFKDFLSNFLRVSKLRDVEGFQKPSLFLSLLNVRPWIFFIRPLQVCSTRIKVTNRIFNGSAQVIQQEVQVISRVKLYLPSFAMFLTQ